MEDFGDEETSYLIAEVEDCFGGGDCDEGALWWGHCCGDVVSSLIYRGVFRERKRYCGGKCDYLLSKARSSKDLLSLVG